MRRQGTYPKYESLLFQTSVRSKEKKYIKMGGAHNEHNILVGSMIWCVYIWLHLMCSKWASWWRSGKEATCQCRRFRRPGFNPWVGKIPWRRKWQPTPVFLPGKSYGQRSLVGYCPVDGRRVGLDWVTEQACTMYSKYIGFLCAY